MRPARPGTTARRRQKLVTLAGANEAPGRSGTPGVPGDAGDHPIAPTEPFRTGPHAGDPGRSPSRALPGCGIRLSGGGSGLRGHADERRLPRSGSPQESCAIAMASGQRSTDSIGAGDQKAPGLRSPQRTTARTCLRRGTRLSTSRVGGHGRVRGRFLTPSQRLGTAGGTPGRSGRYGWGGRLPPSLKRGRRCGPNATRHGVAAGQAGK